MVISSPFLVRVKYSTPYFLLLVGLPSAMAAAILRMLDGFSVMISSISIA